jgi:urea transporter
MPAPAATGRSVIGDLDGVMPAWSARLEHRPALDFVHYTLRGAGQVVFMNNAVTGLLILTALWIASAWLGFGATLGLVASTAAALVLGLDRAAIRGGLYGFNGTLVGAALATFLVGEFDAEAMACIVGVAAFSTVLMATLSRALVPTLGVPPLTLPFNFATLAFLAAASAFATVDLSGAIDPRLPAIGADIDTTLRAHQAAGGGGLDVASLVNAVLRGVSEVFLADSAVAGALILAGIAICSRIAAAFALVGSIVGMLTALAVGADGYAIYHGLWGFNPVLCAMAIGGVFYVLTWRSGILAVACAIAGAVLFASIGTLLAPLGLPALTLPFCLATLAFLIMKGTTSRFTPVALEDVSTPEAHRQAPTATDTTPGRDAVGELR